MLPLCEFQLVIRNFTHSRTLFSTFRHRHCSSAASKRSHQAWFGIFWDESAAQASSKYQSFTPCRNWKTSVATSFGKAATWVSCCRVRETMKKSQQMPGFGHASPASITWDTTGAVSTEAKRGNPPSILNEPTLTKSPTTNSLKFTLHLRALLVLQIFVWVPTEACCLHEDLDRIFQQEWGTPCDEHYTSPQSLIKFVGTQKGFPYFGASSWKFHLQTQPAWPMLLQNLT